MHHIHPDAVGWRVDPWLVHTRSDFEPHRDQARVVRDIVPYAKLFVFSQVRDRLVCPPPTGSFVSHIVRCVQDGTF